jgi:hypothetical protein
MHTKVRLLEVLRATLLELENNASVSPDYPGLITLKDFVRRRIAELEAGAAPTELEAGGTPVEAEEPAG